MRLFSMKKPVFCVLAAAMLLGCALPAATEPMPAGVPTANANTTPMPASEDAAVLPVHFFSSEQIIPGTFAAADNKYVLEERIEDGICSIVLAHADGETLLFDNCSYFSDAYLVTGTELMAPILFVCADEMSDDYAVVSCMLTAGGADIVDRYSGRITAVDTERKTVMFAEHITVMGSWIGMRGYDILPDGRLQPEELGLLTIANGAERPVTLAVDLVAEVFSEGIWQQTVLEAGTQMFPTETDGKSIVYATLSADGRLCRLLFTKEDWEPLFDGIPEWEVFTDLIYAG